MTVGDKNKKEWRKRNETKRGEAKQSETWAKQSAALKSNNAWGGANKTTKVTVTAATKVTVTVTTAIATTSADNRNENVNDPQLKRCQLFSPRIALAFSPSQILVRNKSVLPASLSCSFSVSLSLWRLLSLGLFIIMTVLGFWADLPWERHLGPPRSLSC